MFFNSGGAQILGETPSFALARDNVQFDWKFDPAHVVYVKIDQFLAQPVLCLEGAWATRGDVIKHLAHRASGVHSSESESDEDILLARIRRSYTIAATGPNGGMNIDLNIFAGIRSTDSGTYVHEPEKLDFVLIEMLSAVHFLTASEDMQALETDIADVTPSRRWQTAPLLQRTLKITPW
jgi:hypothetical protein